MEVEEDEANMVSVLVETDEDTESHRICNPPLPLLRLLLLYLIFSCLIGLEFMGSCSRNKEETIN